MQSKYKAIYQKYVEMIESGKLSPGDSLPSEGKMTETFDTSRDTIRKAMTLLEQNNYILKSRGKESVVLERLQEEESTDAKMFSYLELDSQDGVEREKLVEDISILVDNEKMM
ncbi:MAG: GntR family transcriptional regulator [Clostridiales bacterium]|nr:GntR family transcriptional regulator [Clostridiales bacterium]